jgi:phosphoheptose isomerase
MTLENKAIDLIDGTFSELFTLLPSFKKQCSSQIIAASEILINAFACDKKLLICGNGGSAADSQHLAAEFVSSFSKSMQRKALPAIASTVDSSIITAYSNDFSFDQIFERQIEALGLAEDVLLVLSTSGDSVNCLRAAKKARSAGMKIIAFTKSNSKLCDYADVCIMVPSSNTQHIQECHMIAYHLLVEIVETQMFGRFN